MNHLSRTELVDAVDGTLGGPRAAHAERCETCQAAVAQWRELFTQVGAAAAVPEPSPLFWDHLSSRVRDAVAAERPGGSLSWWSAPVRALTPLGIAALLVLLTLTMSNFRQGAGVSRSPATSSSAALDSDVAFDAADISINATDAAAWDVLIAAAADLQLEDAHAAGMSVAPSALDHAMLHLNPDELAELSRLLQSELKRSN